MSDLSNATNSVTNAAPVDPNMATGLAGNDPASVEAITGLNKYRGSMGFAVKSAITGAGLGAQAGQGAMNPLTAFLQGAAAGLQAPAQVFAQKQAQVKSTLDAMPFAIRFPDMAKRYPLLGGMPSALALDTLKTIATDTQKVIEEHQAKIGEQAQKGEQEYITEKDAQNYAGMLGMSASSLVGLPKSDVKDFMRAKGVSTEGFGDEKLLAIKKDFDSRDTIQAYKDILPDAGTINAVGSKPELTPQDQVLLARAFLNIQSAKGSSRVSTEMLNIIENPTYLQRIKKAATGQEINLSPQQIHDMVNAANIKINEINSNAKNEAENWKPLLKSKTLQDQKFVLGEFANEPIKEEPKQTLNFPEGYEGIMPNGIGFKIINGKAIRTK